MNDSWLIKYEDGREFSSADGAWSDAPATGVLYVVVSRCRAPAPGRDPKRYSRRLTGFQSYYLRDVGGTWEFGCHADETAATTPPGVPAGERYIWAPGSVEQVFDAPELPAWAHVLKLCDGPPWPWERCVCGHARDKHWYVVPSAPNGSCAACDCADFHGLV